METLNQENDLLKELEITELEERLEMMEAENKCCITGAHVDV
jgi:hypothetical protein